MSSTTLYYDAVETLEETCQLPICATVSGDASGFYTPRGSCEDLDLFFRSGLAAEHDRLTWPRTSLNRRLSHVLRRGLRSRRNPFSRNGVVTRFFERLPVVNHIIQVSHKRAGDAEAYERARQLNPLRIRSDGLVVRAAEHLPLINNVLQQVHRVRGSSEALERARKSNPLGRAGYLTQVGEHIPGLADTIRCIHIFRGNKEEAERARAFSLAKLVSREGAVVKLAELLPGMHLVAAAIHDLRGDRQEARRALDIVGQWKDVASADGALARVAEFFPGTDVIAFGLMVNSGLYANALRAVCKTRWVDVKSRSTVLVMSMGEAEDWLVLDLLSDLEIAPKAASIAGGLLDLCIHFCDFNSRGFRRKTNLRRSSSGEELVRRQGLRGVAQGVKIVKANEQVLRFVGYFAEQFGEFAAYTPELMNWAMYEWTPETRSTRRAMWAMYIGFPPMPFQPAPSRAPSALLAQAVADSVPDMYTSHGEMPLGPNRFRIRERSRSSERRRRMPEAAATVSCASLCGALGTSCSSSHPGVIAAAAAAVHAPALATLLTGAVSAAVAPALAVVACLTGCGAGLGFLSRRAKRNMISWFNANNAAAWRDMAAPVVRLVPNPAYSQAVAAAAAAAASAHGATGPEAAAAGAAACDPWVPAPDGDREVAQAQAVGGAAAAGSSEGIVFEWSTQVITRLQIAETLRAYVVREWLRPTRLLNWVHPAVWAFQLFERHMRSFMNDALDGQTVPYIIAIPMPAGVYSGIECWLPEIRVMLILWLRFTDERYITRIQVALVDGMLDQIINVAKAQCLPKDLRLVDPRLNGFTEPIDLRFDVALKWAREDRLRLELNDIHVKLHLPR